MINTSIHGVTRLSISEPVCMVASSSPYYCRTLTLATQQGKKCTFDLYGESLAALTSTESAEADFWRTQAAEESARADEAESELARLRHAIDAIANGEAL